MKKEMNDYDLDVMNALKDFPKDISNSVIYVRGGIHPISMQPLKGFAFLKGGNPAMFGTLLPLIMEDETFRGCAIAAILNYFKKDRKMAEMFVKQLGMGISNIIRP